MRLAWGKSRADGFFGICSNALRIVVNRGDRWFARQFKKSTRTTAVG